MCDPVSMAVGGFAIQGAQAIAGYAAGNQQADEINRNSYLQAIFNNVALAQTYNQLNNERVNERNAASEQLLTSRLHVAEAKATAKTAAGEAGVGGASQSLNALMQDYAAKSGRAEGAIKQSYANVSDSIQAQEEAAYLGTKGRNMALPRANRPSALSLGLQIAGAGVNAAGNYYAMKNYQRYGNPNVAQ